MKSGVGRGHAAVDGRLQEHFFDLVAGHSVVKRGLQVHTEFLATIQSDHHRECQQAAGVEGKAGARPYFAPGVAGYEVLEVAVEIGGGGNGAVDMLVAKNGTPDFHALPVALLVVSWLHRTRWLHKPCVASSRKKIAYRFRERASLFDV